MDYFCNSGSKDLKRDLGLSMPLRVKDEFGRVGAVIEASGDVTSVEILETNNQFYARDDFETLRYQLWHFPAAIAPKATTDDMRSIALQGVQAVRRNPECRVAVVVESPALHALARLYELYSLVWSKGLRVGVFKNVPDARRWLTAECPDLK